MTKGLVAALGFFIIVCLAQAYRLNSKSTQIAELEKSIAETNEKLASANNKLLSTIIDAGETAREKFEQKQEEDAPVLERVVVTARSLCVQHPAAGGVRVPVPEAPRVATDATERAGDNDDDEGAFIDALERDIRYCVAELNRLSRLQDFARSVSQ